MSPRLSSSCSSVCVATEATQIEICPEDLRENLISATDLGANGVTLTQTHSIDFDTVKTKPATLSGLVSVIQQGLVRDLEGVFEVHSVAVMGVSPVVSDGGFQMRAPAADGPTTRAAL